MKWLMDRLRLWLRAEVREYVRTLTGSEAARIWVALDELRARTEWIGDEGSDLRRIEEVERRVEQLSKQTYPFAPAFVEKVEAQLLRMSQEVANLEHTVYTEAIVGACALPGRQQ